MSVADQDIAHSLRTQLHSLTSYSEIVRGTADAYGLAAKYSSHVVTKCIAMFLQNPYIRPGPGRLFHERAPLSSFKPTLGRPLSEILNIFGSEAACAHEILDLGVISITEDDPTAARYRGVSLAYESLGSIVRPRIPTTLSEFGKIVDAMKSQINNKITEIFCSDTEFMMSLLGVHLRVSDFVSNAVKDFMTAPANASFFNGVTDFNPFALKGGNVFKITKFLLESNIGMNSSLNNLSDHDFSIAFPKSDDYYRQCNGRYNMHIPMRHAPMDYKLPEEDANARDSKYYELYDIIFSSLTEAVNRELATLSDLDTKYDEIRNYIISLTNDIPGLELLDADTFYPLRIMRKNDDELFMMQVNDPLSERRYKDILSSPTQFIINRLLSTKYFRTIEMSIADYSQKRQGVYVDITKNGFRLFRAQLPFNLRVSLTTGVQIDKIVFAEIFDYATSFLYTHDMCDSYDHYEILHIRDMNIKSHSIKWFINDVLTMIDGGVESPKHAKRIVRIATLVNLTIASSSTYINSASLTEYLKSRSPRDYIVRDKLLELIDKYKSQVSAADEVILMMAAHILAAL